MTNLFSITDRGLWTESSEKKYNGLKWKDKEKGEKGIFRPGIKEGCIDTMAPNGCESSGVKAQPSRDVSNLVPCQCPTSPCRVLMMKKIEKVVENSARRI